MEKNKKLIIVIAALIVVIAGVSFLAFNEFRKNKEMTEVFAVEKEEMENEYSTFATQYDELQVQINNDSLREKLESEKLKTQRLLEELRQVKSSNAAEIIRLKKELKTVRAVLRSYVMQIDSLNRINAALMEENQDFQQFASVMEKRFGFTWSQTRYLRYMPLYIFDKKVLEEKKQELARVMELIEFYEKECNESEE